MARTTGSPLHFLRLLTCVLLACINLAGMCFSKLDGTVVPRLIVMLYIQQTANPSLSLYVHVTARPVFTDTTAGQVTCQSGSQYASNFTVANVNVTTVTTSAQLMTQLQLSTVANGPPKVIILAAGTYTLTTAYIPAVALCLQVSVKEVHIMSRSSGLPSFFL